MANPWMTHLAKVIKANPGKALKQYMQIGKKISKDGLISVWGSIRVGGKMKPKIKNKKRREDYLDQHQKEDLKHSRKTSLKGV